MDLGYLGEGNDDDWVDDVGARGAAGVRRGREAGRKVLRTAAQAGPSGVVCWRCGKAGHVKRDCRVKLPPPPAGGAKGKSPYQSKN